MRLYSLLGEWEYSEVLLFHSALLLLWRMAGLACLWPLVCLWLPVGDLLASPFLVMALPRTNHPQALHPGYQDQYCPLGHFRSR